MKKLLNYMIIFLISQQTCFGMCSVDDILNSQVSHETSLFSVVGALAFVIALIFLTGFIYAKLNVVGSKLAKKTRNSDIEDKIIVLSSTHLNNNQSLHVVEVNGKKLLLGATQSELTVLKDLGEVKDRDYHEDVQEEHINNKIEIKEEEKSPLDNIFNEENEVEEKHFGDDDEDFGLYKKYL